MRFYDWITKHKIEIRFTLRGFNIENEQGDARYVEIFDISRQPLRHVDDRDVRGWIKANLDDELFTEEARHDFHVLVR
jgi:hypothetical protein